MMAGGRAPVFVDEIDVSDFAPSPVKKDAHREQVQRIAEPAAFHSREPAPGPVRREMRRYRTGRNVQLNLKVRQEDADAFYALADKHGWVLGEAFQNAVEALRKRSDS